MNLVETYPYGIQTKTFSDPDTGATYFHVVVYGRLVWRREARKGTHQKNLHAIATAQRHEALHLVQLEERNAPCMSNYAAPPQTH